MKKLEFKIAAGLGDNIILRMALDTVKHEYEEIRISHNKQIVNDYRDGDPKYFKLLDELGALLFSDPPYIFDHGDYPEIYTYNTYKNLNIVIKNPKLDHLLCKGESLKLDKEYIVITTKIRTLSRNIYNEMSNKFWQILKILSNKYKIVIMGEREMDGGYNPSQKDYIPEDIFSIYNDIINNVPSENLIDLTVPVLGITSPELSKIQQDCLIMKEAKFTIANGIGGNVWLAIAAGSKTIGFRSDEEPIINIVINPQFENIFITKNQQDFFKKLEEYI